MATPERPVGERTGEVGLAEAGGPGDDHVAGLPQEAQLAELVEGAAVQAARAAEVDLLDRRLDLELGGLGAPGQAAPLARCPLALDQKAEAFGEGELGISRALDLLGVGFGHRPQTQVVETI